MRVFQHQSMRLLLFSITTMLVLHASSFMFNLKTGKLTIGRLRSFTLQAGSVSQAVQSKPKAVFVLGGPGSGKGTQCEKLAKEFGLVHLSAGELLRQEITKKTENGKIIDDYLRRGQIVPVNMSLSLLKQAMLAQPCYRYLIDGFPRNQDNLQGWQREMPEVCDLDMVLVIDCNQTELERRILSRGNSSGRSDDNLEVAIKRFKTFERETMPILEHFAAQKPSLLVRVDGAQSVDAVYASVQAAMRERVRQDVLDAHMLRCHIHSIDKAEDLRVETLDGTSAVVSYRRHQQQGNQGKDSARVEKWVLRNGQWTHEEELSS